MSPNRPVAFGSNARAQADLASEELQKLFKDKGLRSSVMASPEGGRGKNKTYQLFVMVNRPDTSTQVRETLARLEEEGFVYKRGEDFYYEGFPVKMCDDYGVCNFQEDRPALDRIDRVDFR
jgi:hypothetical protein